MCKPSDDLFSSYLSFSFFTIIDMEEGLDRDAGFPGSIPANVDPAPDPARREDNGVRKKKENKKLG